MEKIFVKPIAFVLGIVLAVGALGLCGCSSGGSSNSGSGVTVKNQDSAASIDRDVSIEKTTLLDTPEITITADSVSFENDRLCLTLTSTNKTNKPISARAGTMGFSANYINNYMVTDGYFMADLEAKETAEDKVYFDSSEMLLLGISKIGEIGLGISVQNNNRTTYDYSQITQQVVSIKTNQFSSTDMESNTYDTAINNKGLLNLIGATMINFNGNGGFEQSGISIKSIALIENKEGEKTVFIEIQNNTDDLVGARSSAVTINDEMAYEGLWDTTAIAPHKFGIMAINLNNVEEMGDVYDDEDEIKSALETVSTVGIEFSVVDKKANTVVAPVELEFSF